MSTFSILASRQRDPENKFIQPSETSEQRLDEASAEERSGVYDCK
jgi:hypothetical protein